jgi:EmrB/QacA subfamily drug resistance transporter
MSSKSNHRKQILLVLFLGVLMAALDIAIVGPALPAIQKTYSTGDRSLAWMFTIYVFFNLIGTPLMAKLADLTGRRRIYIFDVSLFAAGSLLVALAPSFNFVLAGRAIQGFGAGGIFPVASAVIGDTYPPKERGRALGMIGAVFGLAFLIGPVLGGILLLAGWQWMFVINLPMAAIVIWLSLLYLPRKRPAKRSSFDSVGMLILAGALACLAYGVNQMDTADLLNSLTSLSVGPFLLAAAVLLLIFTRIERQTKSPVVQPELFTSKQMLLAFLLSAGAGVGEASIVFLPAFAVAAFHMTSSAASFLLIPVVLAMAVGSPLAGRLLDKIGSRAVILAGTELLMSGLFLLNLSGIHQAVFIAASLLIGFGLSALLGAPVRYIVLNEAPPEDRSAAQGVVTLFTSTGQLLAAALAGAAAASMADRVAGYREAYLVIGMVTLLLVLLSLGLKRRAAEQATTTEERA